MSVLSSDDRRKELVSTAALAQDGHDRIINQVAPQVIDQGRSPQSQGNRIPRDSLKAAQDMWKTIFQRQSQSTELNPTTRSVALSAANQRCNQPWGDILEAKESTVTRMFALNVNGLSLDRRGGQFATLCGVQKEIQADILCGRSEHNLDTLQPKVRSILYDTSRQYWDRNKMIFGTSLIPFHSVYKPGGTFMITTGNLTGRVVHQSADHWGRWVTQEFQGRGTTRLVIVSIYQVVDKRGTEGQTTAAAQQHSLLVRAQDPITQPRAAFRRDLLKCLCIINNKGLTC